MRETRIIMGMPVTVDIPGARTRVLVDRVFAYFEAVDQRFSPYKPDSEVSAVNRGEIDLEAASPQMQEVLALSLLTESETEGYFNVRRPDGTFDPSGLVKGWAIRNAARLIEEAGVADYAVEAGGDMQCRGVSESGARWRIGIRSPFDADQIVKIVQPGNRGVATSGAYVRGAHIYDPRSGRSAPSDLASLTVIAADIYDADRFATAAYAMGRDGIGFLETLPGIEAYAISGDGVATLTSGFKEFVVE